MKTKIEEVQQYFKEKLLAGHFEPISFEVSYTIVSIDGYEFCIWNGELNPQYCRPWKAIGRSFMALPDFTPIDSETLYIHIKHINDVNSDKIRIANIARLETELAKLKGVTE